MIKALDGQTGCHCEHWFALFGSFGGLEKGRGFVCGLEKGPG